MGYRLRTWNRSSCSNPSSSYQQVVEWRKDAACLGYPVNDWFPETKELNLQDGPLSICEKCPVIMECLEYALVYENEGIWGGTLPADRVRIRRERNIRLMPVLGKPRFKHPNCGTNAGYVWLLRYNKANPEIPKEICKFCLVAHQLYNEIQPDSTKRTRQRKGRRPTLPMDKSEWTTGGIF